MRVDWPENQILVPGSPTGILNLLACWTDGALQSHTSHIIPWIRLFEKHYNCTRSLTFKIHLSMNLTRMAEQPAIFTIDTQIPSKRFTTPAHQYHHHDMTGQWSNIKSDG